MQALTIMPREANIRQRPVLLWTKRDAKMNARTLEKKNQHQIQDQEFTLSNTF